MRRLLKSLLYRTFRAIQPLGVNILPNHFYSGVPDLNALRASEHWRPRRSLIGVRMRPLDDQLDSLRGWLQALPADQIAGIFERATRANGTLGFGPIEAVILAAFIASQKPRHIIQIGCGVSTAVILEAAEHAGVTPRLDCIEPYPNPFMQEAAAAGRVVLHPEPTQRISLDLLTDLGPGDFLFIDSTHAVKAGGEVNLIIHEVLPRLRAGVWVHFHDITFPYDYPRNILDGEIVFPAENTLLQAYLTENPFVSVELCLGLLHYDAPDQMKEIVLIYEPQANDHGMTGGRTGHFPSSLYFRRVAD